VAAVGALAVPEHGRLAVLVDPRAVAVESGQPVHRVALALLGQLLAPLQRELVPAAGLLGAVGYPLLAYLLAGSAVSNALILRPLLFSMFWIAVALAALRQDAARAALRATRAAAPPRPAMAPARPADRRRVSAAAPRRGRW
jgi:hypothetical protein